MQNVEGCNVQKRIEAEVRWCFTYEQEKACAGASGRKLRQVCVWCPNYRRKKDGEDEKNY